MKHELVGKRIRLTGPMNDPQAIEVGSEGTITNVGFDVINVKWDNGRRLGLIMGEDSYVVFEEITLINKTK